eukprot:2479824-Amphidinium_carterae.1
MATGAGTLAMVAPRRRLLATTMGAVGLALRALSPLPQEAVLASHGGGRCSWVAAHPTHSSLLPADWEYE